MKTLPMRQKKYGRYHMKKDKWQNKDDQNVTVAMAFKALINRT